MKDASYRICNLQSGGSVGSMVVVGGTVVAAFVVVGGAVVGVLVVVVGFASGGWNGHSSNCRKSISSKDTYPSPSFPRCTTNWNCNKRENV